MKVMVGPVATKECPLWRGSNRAKTPIRIMYSEVGIPNTTFLNAYNFDTLVYDAKTLYAKWLEAITLSFEENGGSTMTDIELGVGEAP